MKIDILTLFPDTMDALLHESILGRAAKKGILDIRCVQIRDYTENKQRQVDDYPYGGGWGCVMMAQPLKSCLDDVMAQAGERRSRVIYMSPQGKTFTQEKARQLVRDYDHLVLVCGHYEGVDERFIEQCVDEEISLGDFVLTGGEIAAMAVTDAVCRLVPGVLSDEACYTGESHWEGLLEYPQYTRPEVWEGRSVPEVLLGGNHAEIERWRRKQMFLRTQEKRPELMEKREWSESDAALLREIERDRKRLVLTESVTCRPMREEDLEQVLLIVRQAQNYLKKHGVDQWQNGVPNEMMFRRDISRDEGYVVCYGERVAGFFALSQTPEPVYEAMTDGKWTVGDNYCVLHRTAVGAEFRGSGLSDRLLGFAESIARSWNASAIRVDTHRKNKAMKALLGRSGFTFRGNIRWWDESVSSHDPRRQAFEKLL